jgi:hypothetical protein
MDRSEEEARPSYVIKVSGFGGKKNRRPLILETTDIPELNLEDEPE